MSEEEKIKEKARRFHKVFAVFMLLSVFGIFLVFLGYFIGVVLYAIIIVPLITGSYLDRKYKTREFMDGY